MYSNLKVQLGTVHEAAEKGSLEKLQEIVAFYAKRNKSEAFVLHEREALLGCQPIHLAVERGHVGFVKVPRPLAVQSTQLCALPPPQLGARQLWSNRRPTSPCMSSTSRYPPR